jgi:2-hydroxychromene-2-carboxylate isomerase
MAPSIDYYFTLISPFSYLGHKAFLDVAAKHGAAVRLQADEPCRRLCNFWCGAPSRATGLAPELPTDRVQRIADIRQLPLTLRPAHFPTNPSLANGAVAAIAASGGDPADFMFAAFQACWTQDLDISQPETVRELLEATGHDAAADHGCGNL